MRRTLPLCLALALPLAGCWPFPGASKADQVVERTVNPRDFFVSSPPPRPQITPMPLPSGSPTPSPIGSPAPTAPPEVPAPSPSPTVAPSPTPVPTPVPPTRVVTLAGSGSASFTDGAGPSAAFNEPAGAAVLPDGTIVLADPSNHRVRKVVVAADGKVTVSTLAGGEAGRLDGFAASARFASPSGVAVGPDGSIYVADTGNHRIRRIKADGAGDVLVTTIAGNDASGLIDGVGDVARFSSPQGLAVGADGSVYVADTGNHAVRRLVLDAEGTGTVATLAGDATPGRNDGTGPAARFNAPRGVATLQVGALTRVLVADTENHSLRWLDAGKVTTLAGNGLPGFATGAANAALFERPWGVAIDSFDPTRPVIYVADNRNHRVCVVAADGSAKTLVGGGSQGGTDGRGEEATFRLPTGLALDSRDRNRPRLVVTDAGNHTVRVID